MINPNFNNPTTLTERAIIAKNGNTKTLIKRRSSILSCRFSSSPISQSQASNRNPQPTIGAYWNCNREDQQR
ncbi:hypothetical protein V6N13_060421 [Hibiscus sabdariffa]